MFTTRILLNVKLKLNFDLDETQVQFRVSQYLCKQLLWFLTPSLPSIKPLCPNPFAIE